MPTISEVCVVYCTDNCTSSDCRSVSGNNPFRINSIVNGTSYNISLSLRNDFGESGQTTALYSEGKAVSAINISIYMVHLYDLYFIRLWHNQFDVFHLAILLNLQLTICFCHREQWRTMCNHSYTNQWVVSSINLSETNEMLRFEYPSTLIRTNRMRIYTDVDIWLEELQINGWLNVNFTVNNQIAFLTLSIFLHLHSTWTPNLC